MSNKLILAAVVAALTFLFALAFAIVATPGAEAHRTPLCGSQSRPAVYVPCRRGHVRKAVVSYMRLLSGNPYAPTKYTYLDTIGDYGPSTWFSDFRFTYNEPGPLHRARRCSGRMIVSAHTGRAGRVIGKKGRC